MNNPTSYHDFLFQKLDSIHPGIGLHLDDVSTLTNETGMEILCILLQYACDSQHIGNIMLARESLLELPYDWLVVRIPTAISDSLNLADEWHYRRLIEALRVSAPELVERYLSIGLLSQNPDVQEVAKDYQLMVGELKGKSFLFQLTGFVNCEHGVGLLPGIPQAMIRNRNVGSLRPGAVLELVSPNGTREQFALETYYLNVPDKILNDVERMRLPLIPVVNISGVDITRVGGEVFMVHPRGALPES